jgi:hypothetical protein
VAARSGYRVEVADDRLSSVEGAAMQNSTDTAEAVTGGYYVLHLLPAVPDEAESILATIEMRCAERSKWQGRVNQLIARL